MWIVFIQRDSLADAFLSDSFSNIDLVDLSVWLVHANGGSYLTGYSFRFMRINWIIRVIKQETFGLVDNSSIYKISSEDMEFSPFAVIDNITSVQAKKCMHLLNIIGELRLIKPVVLGSIEIVKIKKIYTWEGNRHTTQNSILCAHWYLLLEDNLHLPWGYY